MEKVRPWCGQPSDPGRLKAEQKTSDTKTTTDLETKASAHKGADFQANTDTGRKTQPKTCAAKTTGPKADTSRSSTAADGVRRAGDQQLALRALDVLHRSRHRHELHRLQPVSAVLDRRLFRANSLTGPGSSPATTTSVDSRERERELSTTHLCHAPLAFHRESASTHTHLQGLSAAARTVPSTTRSCTRG